MKTIYIYVLIDPRDNAVRYIGKTNNPGGRLDSHISRPSNDKNSMWVLDLKSAGIDPRMEILEETDEENWQEAERYWIASGKENGWNLNNISKGGGGGNGAQWHRDGLDIKAFEKCLTNEQLAGYRKLGREEKIRKQKEIGKNLSSLLLSSIKNGINTFLLRRLAVEFTQEQYK